MKYQVLSLLPKNLESYVLGKLSRISWPMGVAPAMIKTLARLLNIDLSDAERGVEEYASLEDLFTRTLKPGARTMQGEIWSPCDSNLRQSLPVDRGQLLQAKGLFYSVDDLLCLSEAEKKDFHPAWYSSFYLAPYHYHRVHTPFAGKLHSAKYVPGELWPVNETFVKLVPRLFCRNERVVFELSHQGGGRAYLVMVGALHVGRIRIKDVDSFCSNDFSGQLRQRKNRTFSFSPHRDLSPGDELGTFMLGSTVILVLDEVLAKKFQLKRVNKTTGIRLGESLLVAKQAIADS